MTRFLLATASVHTTAAAADYLGDRLDADDGVLVLTAAESDLDDRDAGDAANVARSRLLPATVELLDPEDAGDGGAADRESEGGPAGAIRAVLGERDVDELVVGPRRGDPEAATDDPPGGTVRALLGDVDVPVVVVPFTG